MSSEVQIGSIVSGYRVERLLGSGAMGSVYLARDIHLDRQVALKLLAPELARDARFRERFLRESRVAAKLEHPSIVPIYHAGEADDVLYLAMRYVDGPDLRDIIKREGQLDPDRVTGIVRQIADALDSAHAAGLVHRDVKPGNILVEGDRAYLCDFGLAKHSSTVNSLTRESAFVGTIDYIAPEQIQGNTVDGRADEYALGCVLYEALTGKPPFRRDSDLAVVFAHLKEPPPLPTAVRPELPDGIDAVVARALAKHVSQRYATCAELAEDAAVGLAGGEVDAPPPRELAHAFLIADVRGYTRYTHQHGDAAAAQLSERFIRLARERIEEQGGRVMATHGDEVVAVFESPRRALRAALAIQGALATDEFPLGVGIGIDAGEAIEVGDDFRGGALNTASRLCSAAGAGEVLASEPVIHLARAMEGIDYLEGRVERLKGIEDPVRVVEVVSAGSGNGIRRRLRRRMHGRRWGRVAALVAVALVATVATLVALTRSGTTGPTVVPGNSVAVVDAASRTLAGSYPVGTTPTDVAGHGTAIWTLNDDAQTISQVDTSTGESAQRGLGVVPIQLAYGAGTVWVAYTRNVHPDSTFEVGILALDPGTLKERGRVLLPGRTEPGSQASQMFIAAGTRLIVAAPSGRLLQVNPTTLSSKQGPDVQADALAAVGNDVWALRSGNTLLRIDPATLKLIRRIAIPSTSGIGTIAIGGGSVWGAEPFTGLVWRADASTHGDPGLHTVRAGLSASSVSFGAGAVWVTSGVDGTLVRIDPGTEQVSQIPIGGAPQRVAIVGGQALVTVDGGAGAAITHGKASGIQSLPVGSCSPLLYGGDGQPDFVIASDLPLDPTDATTTQAMVQAVEYTLRRHDFRAGPYRIGFQSCDDASATTGVWTDGKCEANAASYAATESVIGVIGPFNSGCAYAALPILNSAGADPVPVVSPTNSLIGLTRTSADTSDADLRRLYPTGARNYVRTYPADDLQAAADIVLAQRLGAHRVAVLIGDRNDSYAMAAGQSFAASARRAGLPAEVVIQRSDDPAVIRREATMLRRHHIDALFLAGIPSYGGGNGRPEDVARAMRVGSPGLTVIAPDAYLPAAALAPEIGGAANSVFVSGAFINDPERELPPEGLRWVRAFKATQPGAVDYYTPYAAQAAEVLLGAIAASDGTRASVISQLFKTHVTNGILGTFTFTKNGDMTPSAIPVFQAAASPEPGVPDRVLRVISVKPPG